MQEKLRLYKLIDNVNYGRVVMEKDGMYYSYDYVTNTWVEDDMFFEYQMQDSVFEGLYEEITEEEVKKQIKEYKAAWGKQYELALNFMSSRGKEYMKFVEPMKKSTKKIEYLPLAIMIPYLLSKDNHVKRPMTDKAAEKLGFCYRVSNLIGRVTNGWLSSNFGAFLEDDAELLNILLIYANGCRNRALVDNLCSSRLYQVRNSDSVEDLKYIIESKKRMRKLDEEE